MTGSKARNRTDRLRLSAAIAALVFVLLLAGVVVLHFKQQQLIGAELAKLELMQTARHELNKGVLLLQVADSGARSPRQQEGLVLLGQALVDFEQLSALAGAAEGPQDRRIARELAAFRQQLQLWVQNDDLHALRPGLQLSYQNLEHASSLWNSSIRNDLQGLVARLARQFNVALALTIAALSILGVLLLLSHRARANAEAILRDSEQRLQLALDTASAGTWEWFLDNNRNFWSQNLWHLYGLASEQHQPSLESWLASIHPDDIEHVQQQVLAARAQGVEFEIEWRVNLPAGAPERWLMARGRPLANARGKPDRYSGIVIDITTQKTSERAHAQELLVEAELKVLKSLLESSLAGYWDWDMHSGQEYMSPSFKRMLGYADDELANVPESWRALMFEQDAADLQQSLERHVASHGAEPYRKEVRYRHKDGSTVWGIRVGQVVEWTPDGAPARMVGCHVDITPIKQLEAEHERTQEHKLSTILDSIGANIYIKDSAFRYTYVNDSYCRLLGKPAEEIIGRRIDDFYDAADSAPQVEADQQAISTGQRVESEWTVVDPRTGQLRTYLSVKVPLRDAEGTAYGLCGISTDVTEIKKAEASRSEQDQLLRDMSAIAQVGGWSFDPYTGKGRWTEEVARIHDLDPSLEPDVELGLAFYVGESRQKIEEAVKRAVEQGEAYDLELEMLTRAQQRKWVRTVGHPVVENGRVVRIMGAIQDITQLKQVQELIWKEANFDPLTELPNRRMLMERLDLEIRKAQRFDSRMAVLLLDLDRFKEVNDSLGHGMGDILLKEAAKRILACVRESDTVARFGGDEFIIVLNELELDEQLKVDRVAQALLDSLAQAFHLQEHIAYVSASIGITMYPEDTANIEDLLKNVEQAMYSAKSQGKNRYRYFTASMQQAADWRMRISTDLRQALRLDQLLVYYQPIVDLQSGEIRKAEALVRWQHPEQGLISPSIFIPIAEETGVITEIGNWIFRTALAQVSLWRKNLHSGFQISVNKSPVQFLDQDNLRNGWLEQIEDPGLPRQGIVIEITEGLLLRKDMLVDQKLLKFRDVGMEVALDDFGTGYSSLSYLKKFDIDYLKIDQSFVRNLPDDPDDMAVCEAIIVMAHKLGIKVIAEGVETVEQRDLLHSYGCDFGQGYLWSRPVSASDFERLMSGG